MANPPASQGKGKQPKSVLDKIEHAILALKDADGSSRQAITKYLKAEFGVENAVAVKKAFKAGVDAGRLLQKGQSFSVKGHQFEAAEGETTKYASALLAAGSKIWSGSLSLYLVSGHCSPQACTSVAKTLHSTLS